MAWTARYLAMGTVVAAVLFVSAGRVDLPFFWAYVAALVVAGMVVSYATDPGLRAERTRPAAPGRERAMRRAAGPLFVVHWIAAGLDVGRFRWGPPLPWWVQVAGLAGLVAGLAVIVWAMRVNPFFSPEVRVQQERNHHLIDRGPYRFVRHPGYASGLLACVAGPLALGSLWSWLPVAPFMVLLVRRTWLEDRFLHRELPGYEAYAARVRFRLVPGIW